MYICADTTLCSSHRAVRPSSVTHWRCVIRWPYEGSMGKARNNASTFYFLARCAHFSQKGLIVMSANNHEELMGMGFHSIINSQLGKPVSLPQSVQELDDGGIACCEGHKTSLQRTDILGDTDFCRSTCHLHACYYYHYYSVSYNVERWWWLDD